jgi:tagaturonate reductase
VQDRFRNPYIEHKWLNIALQYSSKMAMRNVPVIMASIQRSGLAPQCMSLGVAAHILFMKCTKEADGKYYGQRNGQPYLINDDNAAFYAECWKHNDAFSVSSMVLARKEIWGRDLLELNGFSRRVTEFLNVLISSGASTVVQQLKALQKTS